MKTKLHHNLPRKAHLILCAIMIYSSIFAQMKFEHTEDGSMSGRKYFDQNHKEINIGS
jgi:hypothetical protein